MPSPIIELDQSHSGRPTVDPSKVASSSSNPNDTIVQLDDDDDEDSNSVVMYDIGFNQQQLDRSADNRFRITQRMEEIKDIGRQVEELNDMFMDIAQMVQEQGCLIDRIDHNIESADHNIDHGKKNLVEVAKSEGGFSKCLCFLLISLIIVGGIIVAVVAIRT